MFQFTIMAVLKGSAVLHTGGITLNSRSGFRIVWIIHFSHAVGDKRKFPELMIR